MLKKLLQRFCLHREKGFDFLIIKIISKRYFYLRNSAHFFIEFLDFPEIKDANSVVWITDTKTNVIRTIIFYPRRFKNLHHFIEIRERSSFHYLILNMKAKFNLFCLSNVLVFRPEMLSSNYFYHSATKNFRIL